MAPLMQNGQAALAEQAKAVATAVTAAQAASAALTALPGQVGTGLELVAQRLRGFSNEVLLDQAHTLEGTLRDILHQIRR
jgi:hypothetical protein